jgi:acyl-CoA thioesterase
VNWPPAGGHVFDESLRLTERSDGHLYGELDTRWWIVAGPNGGFLCSLCLHALQHVVGDQRQPRTLSVHFPGRATEGPIQFEVQLDKEGRAFTFASGRMWQSGRLLSTFLGAFAPAGDPVSFDDSPMPDVKMPEDLYDMMVPDEMIPEFSRHFDYRVASEFALFSGADRAEATGWVRFKVERFVDALMIPTIADAFYPAVFAKLNAPADVPTIDLTVHFRATLPLPYDWLLGRFRTSHLAEGFFEEDGEIWSRDGTLVAQSRQLALLRPFDSIG